MALSGEGWNNLDEVQPNEGELVVMLRGHDDIWDNPEEALVVRYYEKHPDHGMGGWWETRIGVETYHPFNIGDYWKRF